MPATLLSLRTDVRYALRDTDASGYGIPSSQLNSWINRAVRRINALVQFYEATDTITPNAVASAFTLVGSGALNLAANYLALRSVYYSGKPPVVGPVDIEVINDLWARGLIVAGSPTKYALWGDQILFDAIPPALPVIYCRYIAVPTDMSADGNAPPAPLHQFDGFIVGATLIEMGGDMAWDDVVSRGERVFGRFLPEFQSLVESGGKHQSLGNTISRRRL